MFALRYCYWYTGCMKIVFLVCSWARMGGRNSVGVRVYRYVFASCMEGRA